MFPLRLHFIISFIHASLPCELEKSHVNPFSSIPALTRATASMATQVCSVRQIGMNAGHPPARMVERASMVWPSTIVAVRMVLPVSTHPLPLPNLVVPHMELSTCHTPGEKSSVFPDFYAILL